MKIRKSLLIPVLALVFAGTSFAGEPFMKHVDDSAWELSKYARWDRTDDGATQLIVEIKPGDTIINNTYGAVLPLDLSKWKGKQIVISGMISGKDIPEQKEAHRCAKIMLFHKGKNGGSYHTSSSALWGTFDSVRQELSFIVPEEVGENTLMAGIQNNHGTARLSKLKIEERDLYPAPFTLPENFRCEYTDRVLKAPRLRGAGCISTLSAKDAADLRAEGANLLRWWINWDLKNPSSIDRTLDYLASQLPVYEKLGFKLIPILTKHPGARFRTPLLLGIKATDKSKNQENLRMFFEKQYLDEYIAIWKKIAKRFKGSSVIHAYSLMNEPTQYGTVPYNYLYCQYMAAKAIREVDPEVPVILSANEWDSPEAFAYLVPLPMKDVIYEVHMYHPHSYTHQGVGSRPGGKPGSYITYPGRIGDRDYTRAQLMKDLKPVIDFQKKYGARIYVGEYSVVRYSPGGAKYLKDLTSVFDELGWDTAYHCFREWENWSFEHPADGSIHVPSPEPTDRQLILRKYWSANDR